MHYVDVHKDNLAATFTLTSTSASRWLSLGVESLASARPAISANYTKQSIAQVPDTAVQHIGMCV